MKRWPWYDQIRDAIFAALAVFLFVFEATLPLFGHEPHYLIILAAIICSGIAGSGILTRKVIDRWLAQDRDSESK